MDKKTVKWYMESKGLVQFKEDEDAFYLTDAVKKFLGDNPLKEDEEVQVEFSKDDDELVVSKILRGKTKEVKKEESKTEQSNETQQTSTENKRIMTVGGVSYKNASLFFEEECNEDKKATNWYNVDIEDCKAKGIKRGVKVEAVIESEEGKRNKVITSIEKVQVEEKKEEQKPQQNTYTKRETSTVQDSIEAQAAVNAANSTVAKLFTGKFDPNKPEDGQLAKDLIKVLATHNHELIQELKSK